MVTVVNVVRGAMSAFGAERERRSFASMKVALACRPPFSGVV